jgi:hypothetical protein
MPLSAYLLDETLWLEVNDAMGNPIDFAGYASWLWAYGGNYWATDFWYCVPLTPQGYLDRRSEGRYPLDFALGSNSETG